MIQAHTGEKQLIKLVNVLLSDENDIFIHVDKSNDGLFSKMKNAFKNTTNVFILDERINVNWSGLSQVNAALSLMRSIRDTSKKYNYIHYISGQDFPIKSQSEMNTFLTDHYGKEFIEYQDISDLYWRIECFNFFRENKNNRKLYLRMIDNMIRYPQKFVVRRNNFKGMKLYYGSQWFTITYDCMLYILNYLDEDPDYLKKFHYTACPDEHFFQIIILNSPFKENVINNNLRFIDWSLGKNSPAILTIKDYSRLKSSQKLFARKFNLAVDDKIIEGLENDMLSNDKTLQK